MAVGTDGLRVGGSDLVECVLGAEYREELTRTLTGVAEGAAPPATSIPVLIGFRRASDNVR